MTMYRTCPTLPSRGSLLPEDAYAVELTSIRFFFRSSPSPCHRTSSAFVGSQLYVCTLNYAYNPHADVKKHRRAFGAGLDLGDESGLGAVRTSALPVFMQLSTYKSGWNTSRTMRNPGLICAPYKQYQVDVLRLGKSYPYRRLHVSSPAAAPRDPAECCVGR